MLLFYVLVFSGCLQSLTNGITIDNELQLIKNDCYERMAIGQRLAAKNVYKTSNVKTVPECQQFCTREQELCKSFSFGIGVKGNTTCELSNDPIKETADLKPIGTRAETDFDLYIKKLGCTLVVEPSSNKKKPHIPPKPVHETDYNSAPKPLENNYGSKPSPSSSSSGGNNYRPPPGPQVLNNGGTGYGSPPASYQNSVEHVQTLVSVSSGPQKPILHPVHEILIGEETYHYGRPPFRPSNLNHPYNNNNRPPPMNYNNYYGGSDRPETDRYDSGYFSQRPIPERYGNYIPRPEDYGRPTRPDDYYRPNSYYERPSGFFEFENGYGGGGGGSTPESFRPDGPGGDYETRPSFARPRPPLGYDSRPVLALDGYENRPVSGFSSGGYENRPKPSNGYENRPNPSSNYDSRPNPSNSYENRPVNPSNGYENRPNPSNGYENRPNPSNSYENRPVNPSNGYENRPNPSSSYDSRPNPSSSNENKPIKPSSGYENRPNPSNNYENRPNPPSDYNSKPEKPIEYGTKPPNKDYLFNNNNNHNNNNQNGGGYGGSSRPEKPNEPNGSYSNQKKPTIVTQSVGYHGEKITSIITELEQTCFRRVLAGKRVARGLVKRAIFCERVEDCQRECADEKRFACEGFNYRLDQSGRGKGECELLDLPLSHLDIGRDLYPDSDYDYYERDRNAARGNCHSYNKHQNYGYDDYDRRYDQRPLPPPRRPPPPQDYDRDRWDNNNPNRRPYFDDRRYDNDDDYDRYGGGNRRGDFAYHHEIHEHSSSHHNHFGHYDHKSYEPYLPPPPPHSQLRPAAIAPPPRRHPSYYAERDRDREKNQWGSKPAPTWGAYGGSYGTNHKVQDFDRRNYYLPPSETRPQNNWGQYGGSYGNGVNLHYNGYGHSQSFDFWGLNKYEEKEKFNDRNHGNYLPPGGGGSGNGNGGRPQLFYLPPDVGAPPGKRPLPPPLPPGDFYGSGGGNNAILPAEPRQRPPPPPRYDFIKDECSLRSATGFRLHKGIVKKFYAVPNIYECEILCFKEKEFPCASYAFRYTISLTTPTDNCYLSNRNYKELDFYTDLQPDRDFDIYTMNNMKRCQQPTTIRAKENSECFFRVRSAQRLDNKVVRDSLTVKSIVECQIECLRTSRFTCRAFSFRYGSPVIGGAIDNCQLTDWPFFELDPRVHFIPEPGFELYERGSYGHGCEPDHFGIRGGPPNKNHHLRLADERCYIGFGSPAKLLNQATRKAINVNSEEECKAECSKLRQNTIFQCMSISFSYNKKEANCRFSDIFQRDLLPNIDYGHESEAWLFAWDNFNPECRALSEEQNHNHIRGPPEMEDRFGYHLPQALDTWRVYSVSGWPCRRGSQCQENREAGFWFCELEGRENHAWDYCCRPDHHCGYSEGFQYPWCYVGPVRTQWRKCSDRYYPYSLNSIDRYDKLESYIPERRPSLGYLPEHRPPVYRPGPRPDRPPAPPTRPPLRPSLDEYEVEFDSQFLEPPTPGGFGGQARHWPLSYLHKEMPPNATSDSRARKSESDSSSSKNPKFAAIQNLIDVIKSNDLKNIQYQISNESNKEDDILFVKIPLPGNFSQEEKNEEVRESGSFGGIKLNVEENRNIIKSNTTKRSQKEMNLGNFDSNGEKLVPVYRRSYVTRTNVTNYRRDGVRIP